MMTQQKRSLEVREVASTPLTDQQQAHVHEQLETQTRAMGYEYAPYTPEPEREEDGPQLTLRTFAEEMAALTLKYKVDLILETGWDVAELTLAVNPDSPLYGVHKLDMQIDVQSGRCCIYDESRVVIEADVRDAAL